VICTWGWLHGWGDGALFNGLVLLGLTFDILQSGDIFIYEELHHFLQSLQCVLQLVNYLILFLTFSSLHLDLLLELDDEILIVNDLLLL